MKSFYTKDFNFFKNKHEILKPHQYGFQRKLSTTHAILDIVTKSYNNININHYTGLLFLNLKKAFDPICQKRLLSKLEHYVVRGSALTLIRSFLKRQQFVMLNRKSPKRLPNDFGVPQGSMLDPLHFLIYVNDMENTIENIPRLVCR